MTARLRYQQTKIDGAPDTILVDAEVVAIIRAQQEWAATWLREHAAPGARPRYLFLGLLFNRNADRPYVAATLHRCSPSWPGGWISATAPDGWSTSGGPTGSGTPGPPAC